MNDDVKSDGYIYLQSDIYSVLFYYEFVNVLRTCILCHLVIVLNIILTQNKTPKYKPAECISISHPH